MTRKPAARLWPAALDGLASLASMTDPSESQRLSEILREEIGLIEDHGEPVQKSVPTEKTQPAKVATRGRELRVQFGEMEIILIGDASDEPWLAEQADRRTPRRFFLRLLSRPAPPAPGASTEGWPSIFEVREVQPAPADSFDTSEGDALVIGARPSDAEPALEAGLVGVVFDVDQVVHFNGGS